jgi:hypothetical protein
MTPNSNISGGTKKLRTENTKIKKKQKKTRRDWGKPKTDLFENRPSRSVSVSVSVSRRALATTSVSSWVRPNLGIKKAEDSCSVKKSRALQIEWQALGIFEYTLLAWIGANFFGLFVRSRFLIASTWTPLDKFTKH